MRLKRSFFVRDSLVVAPDILGKHLNIKKGDVVEKRMINEVEVYRGEEDKAAHSRFGKTKRNRVMYEKGGLVYVLYYLRDVLAY
jgi:DNA-3-methyladenine glycosylase